MKRCIQGFKTNRAIDWFFEKFFYITGFISLSVLFLIMLFLFKEGMPLFADVSLTDFICGMEWYPTSHNPRFGILPLVTASFSVTMVASFLAVPFSISVAVYLAELASPLTREIVKPLIEIIASLPSVVLGFFGMAVLAPFLQNRFGMESGLNWLNASMMLAFMSIPTMASIAEDAMSAVPHALKEASLALGATHFQTIFHITIPAALSGIFTAVILGISRVVGETMIVLMVSGGAAVMPGSLFDPLRPLTSNIAAEMAEAPVGSLHYRALFATGIILFLVTFAFNILAGYLSSRYRFREK